MGTIPGSMTRDTHDSLEREVESIRAALLERHGIRRNSVLPAADVRLRVEDVALMARVNAHWGIASDIPVVGPLLVFFRRILRLTLRWYINPIVDQQNSFNDAVVRALYDLRAENERLHAELGRIRQHIAATEESSER